MDSTLKAGDGCAEKKEGTFIGVAISGGGSRAANYAAAVLRELDSIGILQNVDVISSVSGGSLASAYVAAKGKKFEQNTFEFWENAKRDLSQNFRSKLLAKLVRPDNLFASAFGTSGRTELMAEVFDDSLLARALWLAGMISVNADRLGRTEVCKWIKARGLSVSESCESEEPHEIPEIPVTYVPIENGGYSVACK